MAEQDCLEPPAGRIYLCVAPGAAAAGLPGPGSSPGDPSVGDPSAGAAVCSSRGASRPRGPLSSGCCALFQGASRPRCPLCRGCCALFQGGFPTQGLSPRPLRLLRCGETTRSHRGAHGRLLCGSKSRQTSKINLKTKHSQSW